MCGRFTLRLAMEEVVAHFGLAEHFKAVPRFNIAPSQQVLAVVDSEDGKRTPAFFRWGLVPAWTKEAPKFAPINAKAETAASSSMFKSALSKHRCLVVADGFYEWQQLDKKHKQPWYFTMKDEKPFAFAGMFDSWSPREGAEPLQTCAILTVEPNELVMPVHNRMPAILNPDYYDAWLDIDTTDLAHAMKLVKPYPAKGMTSRPVSSYVSNAKHEGPECLAPKE